MSFKNSKPKWDTSKSVVANAKETLPKVAEAYFAEGDKILNEDSSLEDHHELRLATKHFRYLLENFEPLYGAGLRSRLADLREVQRILGELNDCVATKALMNGRGDSGESLGFLDREAAAKVAEFRQFWSDRFSEAKQRLWLRYFGTQASLVKRTPRKPGSPASSRLTKNIVNQ
ncbi:MAG: CHAD domain-containing protein [Bryobacteraceae bacterium]|nr:CHAD domain-containing protein [Bryobacteraceae bacterium]